MAHPQQASNRDARTGKPRVQQLRPTNKDVVAPAAASTATAPAAAAAAPAPSTSTTGTAQSTGGAPRVVPRIVTGQGAGSTIIVNSCQRGNPVLQHVRNVGWEYGDIVPDYQVGVASCALFLSLRYHRLHPEYIHSRIQKLGNMYSLRILLVMCDVDQHQSAIKELTKVSLVNNLTVMLAWTPEEAGSYLERYKAFEHRPPDLIRERVNDDYMSHLTSALTSIKGINKTDVVTLATNFGSLHRIAQASDDELALCPGLGERKIRRLQEAFTQPFRVGETRTGRERRAERERRYGRQDGQADDRSDESPGPRPRSVPHTAEGPRRSGSVHLQDRERADAPARRPGHDIDEDAPDDILNADDDEWGHVLEGMTEEERLQLAMEMSMSGEGP